MSGFLRSLALLVSVVNITIAGANDQVKGIDPFGSKRKVQCIVAEVVTLEH